MATLPLRFPFTSSLSGSRRRCYQASFTGMAINKNEVYKPNSMEISADLESDDLWLSLSSFMDDKGQETSAASQSLMGLSSSLFNDVDSFVMDKEEPAEYVPAPAISVEDAELNSHLETVLYTLKEVLPGPMVKSGMDNKLLEAWSFLTDDIKVQDPLICLEGKDRLWTWLHTLAATNAHMYLDEIYAERSRAHPFKGFIHAIWTLVFPEELQSTLKHPMLQSPSSSLQLKISGESKFEVDRTGQVASIESKWYVTKGGQEETDFVKALLASLLLKEEHR